MSRPAATAATGELHPAQIAWFQAEAQRATAEARGHELKNIVYQAEVDDRMASLEMSHIYPFYTPVLGSTVAKAMAELHVMAQKDPECPITIVFNSPGGLVTEGFAFYDFLRDLSAQGHPITTKCIGAAASMGAVLMQAGDERIMTPTSFMMVHEISGGDEGTVAQLKDTIAIVERFQEKALDILTENAKITRAALKKKWVKTDWFLDANEALKHGFIDRIES